MVSNGEYLLEREETTLAQTALNKVVVQTLNSAQSAVGLISAFVDKPYYESMDQLEVIPCTVEDIPSVADHVWLYKITRLAYEKDNRDFVQRLGNVLSAVGMCGGTLIMRIDYAVPELSIQIGVLDRQRQIGITALKDTLYTSFKGNFPGSELNDIPYGELCSVMKDYVDSNFSNNCVTAVSTMAKQSPDNTPLRGLESILGSAGEKPFSILILGEPMNKAEREEQKQLYESLATQLSKFVNLTFSQQQGSSTGSGSSMSENYALTLLKNLGVSEGDTVTEGHSEGDTTRDNPNRVSPALEGIFAAGKVLAAINGNIMALWAMNGVQDVFRDHPTQTTDRSTGKTKQKSHSRQKNESVGVNVNLGTQRGTNINFSANEGFSAQYSMVNHTAKSLYDKIVRTLEWMAQNENYGMFKTCAYVLSASASTNMTVASQYASMMNGESIARTYGINSWIGDSSRDIRGYLSVFRHPEFHHPDLGTVDPSVSVSGTELVHNFLLPQTSIGQLSVLHYEPFGRNVIRRQIPGENGGVVMGCIHHMGSDITSDLVSIDVNSLSRHSFIGGANGIGKSTAIFTLLNKVYKRDIPFMVIEPAKGEYRKTFSGLPGVRVYSPMGIEGAAQLHINLFWFREGIDINEHVEKLVEIFSSCWPMYAAMPQVLRDAIFSAYEKCGWDLENSTNPWGRVFPGIRDVCDEIERLVKSTAFSAEVQGNYIGSLLTRMQSLDKGIYRKIFASGDMGDEALFGGSVILDISRPDASEVKALLMGVVIVRHMEYCMSELPLGDTLKHLTVLEEAHTLLAPKPASSEGADIGNKAIEMMARSIAELGGFGQGFVIVDQAPGLLDRSVIRNTNTKLIFRLPDMDDCELTGKAVGLNSSQYAELSRLSRGICAIHQLSWEEAVLCHISPDLPQENDRAGDVEDKPGVNPPAREEYLVCLLTPFSVIGQRLSADPVNCSRARAWAANARYPASERLCLLKAIKAGKREWKELLDAVHTLGLSLPKVDHTDLAAWTEEMVERMNEYISERSLALTLIEALLDLAGRKDVSLADFHDLWFDSVKDERTSQKLLNVAAHENNDFEG